MRSPQNASMTAVARVAPSARHLETEDHAPSSTAKRANEVAPRDPNGLSSNGLRDPNVHEATAALASAAPMIALRVPIEVRVPSEHHAPNASFRSAHLASIAKQIDQTTLTRAAAKRS
jgi:hypothetical protein